MALDLLDETLNMRECACARVPAASAASLVAVTVVGVVTRLSTLVAAVIWIKRPTTWPTEAGLPGHSV